MVSPGDDSDLAIAGWLPIAMAPRVTGARAISAHDMGGAARCAPPVFLAWALNRIDLASLPDRLLARQAIDFHDFDRYVLAVVERQMRLTEFGD